jgi:hypothetical protein
LTSPDPTNTPWYPSAVVEKNAVVETNAMMAPVKITPMPRVFA